MSQIPDRIKRSVNSAILTDPVFLAAIALTLAKLLLITGQKVLAFDSPYDDILFLSRARDLQEFEWMGSYNHMTLIKGIFYPFWIAVVHMAGIPLLISQHILYAFACAVTVISLRQWVQSPKIQICLYAFLLFNPMSFSITATRVIREGIYPSLTLLVVACAIALLSRRHQPSKSIVRWAGGLGISLSAFWLTREEGIWIMPLLILILGVTLILLWREKPIQWPNMAAIGILPFLVLVFSLGAVATMNKLNYGIFSTVELKDSNFLDAYGALSRVKPAKSNPHYPVPKETREKIYDVSAAFAELRPFLEGQVGAAWTYNSCAGLGLCDDIGGGCFVWALREAVVAAGHHKSGTSAMVYYRRLASEINAACEDNRLSCLPPRSTMTPVWHNEYKQPFFDTVPLAVRYLAGFSDFSVQPIASTIPMSLFDLYSTMTRERISPPSTGLLHVEGWAVAPPSSPLSFSVLKENGQKADDTLERSPSPDVYKYFLAKGQDIPGARDARFQIATSCYPGCSLLIESANGISEKLPLDGTVKGRQTASLIVVFDNVNVVPSIIPYSTGVDKAKLYILDKLGKFYQTVMPSLTVLSFAGYCICTFFVLRRRLAFERWIITTSLIAVLAARIILLSIIHIS